MFITLKLRKCTQNTCIFIIVMVTWTPSLCENNALCNMNQLYFRNNQRKRKSTDSSELSIEDNDTNGTLS